MEDIMLIRSGFMKGLISKIINKALRKQVPGLEVQLNEAQVNWNEKEQKLKLHLELDAEMTKPQLLELLKKTGAI